jgi:hypothetical protein
MRSSAAFSRLIESSIGFFSEGTSSARGWRWPVGASPEAIAALSSSIDVYLGFAN